MCTVHDEKSMAANRGLGIVLFSPAQVIDKFNETSISACVPLPSALHILRPHLLILALSYCTAGNCKFLLLHDGKSDDSVKSFFVDVHDA